MKNTQQGRPLVRHPRSLVYCLLAGILFVVRIVLIFLQFVVWDHNWRLKRQQTIADNGIKAKQRHKLSTVFQIGKMWSNLRAAVPADLGYSAVWPACATTKVFAPFGNKRLQQTKRCLTVPATERCGKCSDSGNSQRTSASHVSGGWVECTNEGDEESTSENFRP